MPEPAGPQPEPKLWISAPEGLGAVTDFDLGGDKLHIFKVLVVIGLPPDLSGERLQARQLLEGGELEVGMCLMAPCILKLQILRRLWRLHGDQWRPAYAGCVGGRCPPQGQGGGLRWLCDSGALCTP